MQEQRAPTEDPEEENRERQSCPEKEQWHNGNGEELTPQKEKEEGIWMEGEGDSSPSSPLAHIEDDYFDVQAYIDVTLQDSSSERDEINTAADAERMLPVDRRKCF